MLPFKLLSQSTPSEEEEEDERPKYSDPGRVLFFLYFDGASPMYEVLDYDSNSCLCWANEGCGIDDLLRNGVNLELEGHYVIESVTGAYFRGDWAWGEDDDEEWYVGLIRRATDEEIEIGVLPDVNI